MGTPWGDRVFEATAAVVDALGPLADHGWDARAGGLEWTCRQTAAHIASDLLRYAAQLAGRTDDAYLRFAVTVADEAPPDELLRIIHGGGHVLAAVVDAAPTDARAWHWGPTDRSGFAAMGVGELLVHTYDITQGLGHDWRPPPALAAVVVERLHAGSAALDDPADVLLWSTGRIEIEGLDRVDDWVWRAAAR
ncbi:hypothetical protein HC251_23700 [Iamia sp. SCSIO 61187]|uniref:maleylpyruvate isomerase N-terminal domain-containing protein n=1 Tax=Iamia sp. SCSIO 61187 TaxID=2722752 RepID=UPI001C634406|nr:maleylpyruvate isomerase N-terminal domain-containing protein [Iamia sp. SCSIO 61187]QYG95134.1 hypothetical protein HC251_23700 [Iamia sp. SCSIO 61187]